VVAEVSSCRPSCLDRIRTFLGCGSASQEVEAAKEDGEPLLP